jgi:hypothetical protein
MVALVSNGLCVRRPDWVIDSSATVFGRRDDAETRLLLVGQAPIEIVERGSYDANRFQHRLELLFSRCGTSGRGDGIVGWTIIMEILQRFVCGFLQGFEFRALIFGERQGFFDAIGVREAERRLKAAAKIVDAGP